MDEINIVVTATDNFSAVLGNFGSIMTGIKSTIDLVSGAFNTVVDTIKPFVDSAAESQLVGTQLEAIIKATGGAAGVTAQQMEDLATKLQGVTRYSDETILKGTGVLLTFRNINGETLERTIPAMLDMAEIFGSVDSAAMQLGKALNDPVNMMGALSRAGVTFSDAQKETIKNLVETGKLAEAQGIILSEVEKQVGGVATAVGETFTGQLEIAKNEIDNVREIIGNAFLPVLTDLLNRLSEFATKPEVLKFFSDLATSISTFITNLDLGNKFTNFMDMILNALQTGDWSQVWNTIQTTLSTGWDTLWNTLFGNTDMAGKIQGFINVLTAQLNKVDWSGVGNIVGDILKNAVEIALQGLDVIVNKVDWKPFGKALLSAIGEMLSGMGSSLKDYVYWDNWVSGIKETLPKAILDGLANGILAGSGDVILAFGRMVSNTIDYVKRLFGIASPSTVFYDIGRDIVLGLINGLLGAIAPLTTAVESIVSVVAKPLSGVLDFLGIGSSAITGTTGGRDMTGLTNDTRSGYSLGGGLATASSSVVNYNFYGPVYMSGVPGEGSYDCAPNPVIQSGSNQLVINGFR